LGADPADLQSAVDALNNSYGDTTFTENNYISDGATIASGIDSLDQQIKDNADAIAAALGGNKVTEDVSVTITKNIEHALPGSNTYTPVSTAGQEGSNMDVYVNGQLLMADTGAAGANADRDYGETSISGVTFRFDVVADANIVYVIKS
jgi:hypothetical protein